MRVDLNSVFFAVAGLYYFILFPITGYEVFYLPILGTLFFAAALGLYLRRREGFIWSMLVLPVGFVFGVAALLASAIILGEFSQSAYTLINGSIILYLLASIYFGYRLFRDREDYGSSNQAKRAKT